MSRRPRWLRLNEGTRLRLRSAGATIQRNGRRIVALYRGREWIVIVGGAALASWLYFSSAALARVNDPPEGFPTTIDFILPQDGISASRNEAAELHIAIGIRSCNNPVRVFAFGGEFFVTATSLRRTQEPDVFFSVLDDSARRFKAYVADVFGGPDEIRAERLFEPDFHGSLGFTEFADDVDGSLPIDRDGDFRGISKPLPAGLPRDTPQMIIVTFQANWLHNRTHGTCYLELPAQLAPGFPGQLPTMTVTLHNWRFATEPGERELPLRALLDDTAPQPTRRDFVGLEWKCAKAASEACSGGYAALSEPNASGKTSSTSSSAARSSASSSLSSSNHYFGSARHATTRTPRQTSPSPSEG
jgi:hypothetical protein